MFLLYDTYDTSLVHSPATNLHTLETLGSVVKYDQPLSLNSPHIFCRSDNERGPLNASVCAVRHTLALLMSLFPFCLQPQIPCHARRSIADWRHEDTLGNCTEWRSLLAYHNRLSHSLQNRASPLFMLLHTMHSFPWSSYGH